MTRAFSRRRLMAAGAVSLAGSALAKPLWAQGAPAIVTSDRMRPTAPFGVQSGDVTADRAVLWSRTDRPARMLVELATNDSFRDARRITGPAALETSDFTAKLDLGRLPAGQELFYRVTFQDLADLKSLSVPVVGRRRAATCCSSGRGTPPARAGASTATGAA